MTQRRGRGYKYLSQMQREVNRKRSKVRARVEHAIGVIKRIFGFAKVRYRGLAKNGNHLFVAAALANLFIVRRPLLDSRPAGIGAPTKGHQQRLKGPNGQIQGRISRTNDCPTNRAPSNQRLIRPSLGRRKARRFFAVRSN